MTTVFRHTSKVVFGATLIVSTFVFFGCVATLPMALTPQTITIQTSSKSLGLFTLRTTNLYKPSYRPSVNYIEVTQEGRGEGMKFGVNKPYSEGEASLEYIVSIDLEQGTYSLGNVAGYSRKFPIISGSFWFPVGAKFVLPPNSIVYLGHVEMVNRQRKEGEKRSGPVIPLIDQAETGYSGGTFDITIADRGSSDIPLIQKEYPALQNQKISTAIMTRQIESGNTP